MQRTDLEELLARIGSGDRAAFEALYDTTSARLHALGVSLLKDRPVAEDTLEQVYLRIWAEAGQQAGSGLSPMAWLVVLARDMAIARLEAEGLPGGITRTDPVEAIWLEGATLPALAHQAGKPAPELRAGLRALLVPDGDPQGIAALAGETVLGVAAADEAARGASDPGFAAEMRQWQERLASLALGLTPVMAPARARQRIREKLGHAVALLSIDPLEQPSRRRWPLALLALALAAGAALWWFLAQG